MNYFSKMGTKEIIKKIKKNRNVFLIASILFALLLMLGASGLYKNYSKSIVKGEPSPEIKGETIQNDKVSDINNSQSQETDKPTPPVTTNIKPNTSQSTSSSKMLQPIQEDTQTPQYPSPPTSNPTTPSEKSWTNTHGTFKYSDLGKTIPMYVGMDFDIVLGWTTSYRCKEGDTITIKQGTKIYALYSQVPDYNRLEDEGHYYPNPRREGDFIFDLREKYIPYDPSSPSCSLKYLEQSLPDDPNSPYYPGNLGIWW